MEKDTIQVTYCIHRREISFLKFLLESYEGVAVPRTIDDHIALVELMIAPGFYDTFQKIIRDVALEMGLSPVLASYPMGEVHDLETDQQPAS